MSRRQLAVALTAIGAAVLYGGGSQYLGSLSMHPWLADVSLLSAPWLAIGFVAGCTQPDAKRAAVLGLACTVAAWLGYGAMTLSPLEGAEFSTEALKGFARSQSSILAGGLVVAPLFGWFGHRWRTRRAWVGALATAAAFCLEPAARARYGLPIGSTAVLLAEIAVGALLAAYVAVAAGSGRRRLRLQ